MKKITYKHRNKDVSYLVAYYWKNYLKLYFYKALRQSSLNFLLLTCVQYCVNLLKLLQYFFQVYYLVLL